MAGVQKLEIAPGEWNAVTETMIAPALGTATLGDIKAQEVKLFCVKAAGEIVGVFVLRVDVLEGRSEGVIVAAAGGLAGVDLVESCLPVIEKMFVDCDVIRIHTHRPGLAKKLVKQQGYRVAELVLMKEKNE